MNTPQNSTYKYGIRLVNDRYVAEKMEEGKSYVTFLSKTGVFGLRLKDAEDRDPLVLKGWAYQIVRELRHRPETGHTYVLFIGKDYPEERFAIEVGDNMLSDFANFMMGILHKCETIVDVKHLYAEYVADLESRYETVEGLISFESTHYDEERGYTVASFYYIHSQAPKHMAWYGNSCKNKRKFRARGKWKRTEGYGWLFLAEEIEFMEAEIGHFHKPHSWYLREAEKGNADVLAELGNLYYGGINPEVHCDYAKAFELYTKAAEAGSAEGQYGLGECYSHGHGVERDDIRAMEWYTKAAEAGHIFAQMFFALLHSTKHEEWMIKHYGRDTYMALRELAQSKKYDSFKT